MTVQSWLEAALADAERRGLSEIRPLLEMLARSMETLRSGERSASEDTAPER